MYDYLVGRLRQFGVRQRDLAALWGISQAAVSQRFTGKVAWTIDEMYELLGICRAQPEDLHIYFPAPEGRRRSA